MKNLSMMFISLTLLGNAHAFTDQSVTNCEEKIYEIRGSISTLQFINGKREGLDPGNVINLTRAPHQKVALRNDKKYGPDNRFYVYSIDVRNWRGDKHTTSSRTYECVFNDATDKVIKVVEIK